MRLKTASVLLAALLVPTLAAAQSRSLTIDDLYDPVSRINFSGTAAPSVAWIDATHYAVLPQGPADAEWQSVDAASGGMRPLFDAARMASRLSSDAAFSDSDAHRLAHSRGLMFNRTYSAALFTVRNDLFVYTFATDRVARLTTSDAREEFPSFSPDGRAVAFVRDHDLYSVDLASGREARLTADGGSKILNGRLDWVYEEEVFGRGQQRAYWWSPDSHHLAFLRIDDGPVPALSGGRPHPLRPGSRAVGLSESRRSESDCATGGGRREWRRGAVERHRQVSGRRSLDCGGELDAGQHTGRVPGAEPLTDVGST